MSHRFLFSFLDFAILVMRGFVELNRIASPVSFVHPTESRSRYIGRAATVVSATI